MRKIIVLALLVTFLISVFVFSASADTISVSGCYYIDAYILCELLVDSSGSDESAISELYDRCCDLMNNFPRLDMYEGIACVGCIVYDGDLFFDLQVVEMVAPYLGPGFDASFFIDASNWVSFDSYVPYAIDFYSCDPWDDIAPFISIESSSPEYVGIANIVSDSGIDSVLDYILVILPFAVGALVTYISVRKGYSYLRSVLNGS